MVANGTQVTVLLGWLKLVHTRRIKMNNLATVIAALVNAANAETAYNAGTSPIRAVREAVPTGCIGYSLVDVSNLDRLKEVISACVNDKKQKFFGWKVIPSNDMRYEDTVVIYLTKTMATKWKEGKEGIPEPLLQYLGNADEDSSGLAS